MPAIKRFLMIWLCLMVLLGLTCGSAWLHLGIWNNIVNFSIAVIKAGLVMFFFMHLGRASATIKVTAFTALFMLAVLAVVSGGDYITRHLDQAPWQSPSQLRSIMRDPK